MSRKQEQFRYPLKSRRSLHSEKREKAQKNPYDRILIVCEDTVNSVSYFNAFIKDISLDSAKVEVSGDCGSAPQSVYGHAQEKLAASDKDNNCYDRVYCVFDVDGHPKLEETLAQLNSDNKSQKNVKNITPIVCDPCFEYWLLLHFEPATKSFLSKDLYKHLKKYIPGFSKESASYRSLYLHVLKPKTTDAIKNSKSTLSLAKREHRQNPSTNLHILIEDLIKESQK